MFEQQRATAAGIPVTYEGTRASPSQEGQGDVAIRRGHHHKGRLAAKANQGQRAHRTTRAKAPYNQATNAIAQGTNYR